MTATPSERLKALGLTLPEVPAPKGTYAPRGGRRPEGLRLRGRSWWRAGPPCRPGKAGGRSMSPHRAAGRPTRATLQGLAAVAAAVGSIDRIRRVIRVGVFVATADGFDRPQDVGNGATDLLVEVFGEAGRPAGLHGRRRPPLNAPVEVEFLMEIG